MGNCIRLRTLHFTNKINSSCCNKNISFTCSNCQNQFFIVEDNEHKLSTSANRVRV